MIRRRLSLLLFVLSLGCRSEPASKETLTPAPAAERDRASPPAEGESGSPVIPGASSGINAFWRAASAGAAEGELEDESREIFHERKKIADLVAPAPGAAVADVGAGSGFMTLEFARRVGPKGKVYSVDINQELLDHIAGQAKKAGLSQVVTVRGDQDATRLGPGTVDIVFVCDTYHHFENPAAMLASIRAALRPGGHLILVDLKRGPDVPYTQHSWPFWEGHLRGDKAMFVKEIESAGFSVVKSYEDAPFLRENYMVRFTRK